MVDLSRRLFLGGALAVAGAAIVSAPAAALVYPTLHGDGVHDDTPALQALIDGQPVWVEGELIRSAPDAFATVGPGRMFLISGTLDVRGDAAVSIVGASIKASDDFPIDTPLVRHDKRALNKTFKNCVFMGNSRVSYCLEFYDSDPFADWPNDVVIDGVHVQKFGSG